MQTPAWRRCAVITPALLLAACSDKPMTLNSNLNGALETKVNGEVRTSLDLSGPIQVQMQMQGPTVKYEGTYISDALLEIVEPGRTTNDWVLAVLGEPNARAELKDGSEIWRWTYKPVEQQVSVIEVFSLFGGGDDKEKKEPQLATRTVFLQFLDGVVTRKWKG
jgi:hypothetical protein